MERQSCAVSPQKATATISSKVSPKPSPQPPVQKEKMIFNFVSKLKMSPRGCLMQLKRRGELPSALDELITTLSIANVIALKMCPRQPTIERADRLEDLLSHALSLTRKFHGVKTSNDIYACVGRVKRLLTVSVRMARALIEAIETTSSDSEDESDDESDSDGSDSESDSDSEEESDIEDCSSKLQKTAPTTNAVVKTTKEQHHCQVAPPRARRPEECKTAVSKSLSELLWKTREEVDKKQKGLLNSTKKTTPNGFKRKESQVKTQLKASFSKSCKKLTTGNMFSVMSDLVTLVKPGSVAKKVTFSTVTTTMDMSQPTKPKGVACPEAKPITLSEPERMEPTISTDDLAKTLDDSFSGVKYEFSKTMYGIAEKLSKSSLSVNPPSIGTNLPIDSPDNKVLTDGSVRFILRASPLTKVLKDRKNNGQPLIFSQNLCTGQVEVDHNKKSASPIKESKLTAVVQNKEAIISSAKLFAKKMQILASRVILTAKRRCLRSHTTAFSTKKECKLSFNFSVSTESTSAVSLGKRSSPCVELPKRKAVKICLTQSSKDSSPTWTQFF